MQRLRVLIRFLSIESTVTPISTSHDQLSFLIPTIYIANDRFKIINEHDFSTRLVRHYSIRIKKKKKETIHRKITHDSQIDTRYEIESTNENPFDQPTKFNKVSVITWWTTAVIGIVSGMIYIGRGGGRGGLKKQHVSDLTKQDGRLLSVLLSLPKLFPGDSTTTTRKPADSPRRPSPTILLSPSWERERTPLMPWDVAKRPFLWFSSN